MLTLLQSFSLAAAASQKSKETRTRAALVRQRKQSDRDSLPVRHVTNTRHQLEGRYALKCSLEERQQQQKKQQNQHLT